MRKSQSIITFGLLLYFINSGLGQVQDSLPELKVTGRYFDSPLGIAVRWVPNTPGLWLMSNYYGYMVEKAEYLKNEPNNIKWEVIHDTIKPKALSEWREKAWAIPVDTFFLMAGQAVHQPKQSQQFTIEKMLEQNDELSNLYSACIIASEFSREAAIFSALRFDATNVIKGKSYLYRITTHAPYPDSTSKLTGVVHTTRYWRLTAILAERTAYNAEQDAKTARSAARAFAIHHAVGTANDAHAAALAAPLKTADADSTVLELQAEEKLRVARTASVDATKAVKESEQKPAEDAEKDPETTTTAETKPEEKSEAEKDLDKLKAGKLIRWGITAGVAPAFYQPLAYSKNAASVPGMGALTYVMFHPGYWRSKPETNIYCANRWGGSENEPAAARAAAWQPGAPF